MKWKRIIKLLIIFVFITGCSHNDLSHLSHSITFQDQTQINYKGDINPVDFIASVDGMTISQSNIEGNMLYISTFQVECPKTIDKVLGKQKLIYRIGNEEYYFHIDVVDNEAPKITLHKNTYSVDENENLKLEDLEYDIEDNFYDPKDIDVSILQEENKYYIQAEDGSENKAKKEIVVKNPENEKSESNDIKSDKNNTSKSTKNNERKDDKKSSQQTNDKKDTNKKTSQQDNASITYHFEFGKTYKLYKNDGTYDIVTCNMSNAMQICSSHLSKSGKSGQCIPVMNVDGTLYTGYELIIN